jgi:hypothetical protein
MNISQKFSGEFTEYKREGEDDLIKTTTFHYFVFADEENKIRVIKNGQSPWQLKCSKKERKSQNKECGNDNG